MLDRAIVRNLNYTGMAKAFTVLIGHNLSTGRAGKVGTVGKVGNGPNASKWLQMAPNDSK